MTDRNLDPRRPGIINQYLPVAYVGSAPGADTNVYILFNSTTNTSLHSKYADGSAIYSDYRRYILSLKNSQAGTFTAYTSPDGGQNWFPYYSVALAAASANTFNNVVVPLEPHPNVQFTWTNGGVAQATWIVFQALDGEEATFTNPTGGSGASVNVTNFPAVALDATLTSGTQQTKITDGTNVATVKAANTAAVASTDKPLVVTQSPIGFGQKTTALSQSVGFASDSPEHFQASMRAPMRSEVLNIPVTTSSVTFDIPDATIGGQPDYRGKLVDMYADGADVYIQFSASTTAAVDETTASVVAASTGGRFSVAPNATPNEPFVLPRGQWRPFQFPATGSFAVKGSVAGKLRTMLSQT